MHAYLKIFMIDSEIDAFFFYNMPRAQTYQYNEQTLMALTHNFSTFFL